MKKRHTIITLISLLVLGFAGSASANDFPEGPGISDMTNGNNNGINLPMMKKPHPVFGPYPVSLEEWTHIIRSFQQQLNRPDHLPGTPHKPFELTPGKKTTYWIRWSDTKS